MLYEFLVALMDQMKYAAYYAVHDIMNADKPNIMITKLITCNFSR